MKHTLRGLALSAALALPAAADTDALAEEYLALPAVQDMMSDMFSAETMAKQFSSSLPPNVDLSDDQALKVGMILSDAMQEIRPDMERLMLEKSIELFTEAELEAMIDFYSSEVGTSVMSKTQTFFSATMTGLNPKITAAVQAREGDIMQILQGADE